MIFRVFLTVVFTAMVAFSQASVPAIEPGVAHDLAVWRAAHYSDVRYKLDLTLEKMSPVLKGTMEIRVRVEGEKGSGGDKGTSTPVSGPGAVATGFLPPIILDWRKIRGSESLSTVSRVTLNGSPVVLSPNFSWPPAVTHSTGTPSTRPKPEGEPGQGPAKAGTQNEFYEANEHLIFRDGVVAGENVIKLDFTSPILTSGSAITRYVDKEDGAEYIYSLFVPSDASTAFPVFDQPDLKARFTLTMKTPAVWNMVSNTFRNAESDCGFLIEPNPDCTKTILFWETKPISTYVFAFAAGPFEEFSDTVEHVSIKKEIRDFYKNAQTISMPMTPAELAKFNQSTNADDEGGNLSGSEGVTTSNSTQAKNTPPPEGVTTSNSTEGKNTLPTGGVSASTGDLSSHIYVRKSQAEKFKPHAAEVFRLMREDVAYLEDYFDYKFPWPKYDLVLIPEFPFGGMEHAGATFVRESAIIFPTEPTKGDQISRANLIFHETAHQWFGDTVTMRWFDDLWLKEGFAEFMAYKALEKIMPEANAWKVFYERNKQAAYLTDSTKGTTAIYQPIANLSAAKSAYGNIVYRKAPSFLRQAEFYLGEDKFQTAVRAFLKKHEFANAGWEDLVGEFENATKYREISKAVLNRWANTWVNKRGVPRFRVTTAEKMSRLRFSIEQQNPLAEETLWQMRMKMLIRFTNANDHYANFQLDDRRNALDTEFDCDHCGASSAVFPNYQDYGYGIFLLDDKSRDYVIKNVASEKDDFLRAMMWGALWDSVREGELAPAQYVDLVVKTLGTRPLVLSPGLSRPSASTPSSRARSTSAKAEGEPGNGPPEVGTQKDGETDEGIIQSLLGRVSTAMNYYMTDAQREKIAPQLEAVLNDRMRHSPTVGQRITFYRAFLNIVSTETGRRELRKLLYVQTPIRGKPSIYQNYSGIEPVLKSAGLPSELRPAPNPSTVDAPFPLKTKDKFDIITRLIILGDKDGEFLLEQLEKLETSDDAKRYAYAARAGTATAESKAKYWADFIGNKDISESWIEAAFVPFNSVHHSDLTLQYLQKALAELPNLKRSRKIFFVNGWLGAFIGGQKSEVALAIVNKFLADNPNLDKDLRLKILENVDTIERAVRIRAKYGIK